MRRKLVTLITVTAAALIAVIGTSTAGQARELAPATAASTPAPPLPQAAPLEPGWS
ncbi:hypothetical protein [Streptomyces sp. NBC_00354]|uniref:hypothetical protein n=1 Tax=Streptomyces sp. NBC_00354 TaxID=2975723 RepID=UPI00224F43E3|nr:hypothetical protein [Streptomyces sp. NBC_00354]WSW45066.1 hypothetical protein OG296_19100 [Streptomyces sp. NBC_01001]